MEKITTQLPAAAYCKLLRQKLDSPFRVFDERITGIVIGPFFAIAHHAQWEWNRRITCECNRAWGFVKETGGKTQVCFLRGKGMLSPFWLLLYTLVCAFFFYVELEEMCRESWLAALGISAGICALTAFQDSLTESGIAGAGEITRILNDPKDYYC